MKENKLFLAPLLLLTAIPAAQGAHAQEWGYYGGWDCGHCWNGCNDDFSGSSDFGISSSSFQSGLNHGIADAQYDHANNLNYNNDGQCCHTPAYWNGFHQGYDREWNNYASSHQTVNNYVTINGNGNEVYLNDRQNSDQNQGPVQNYNGPGES
jgi:hypothetical protein